MKNRTCIETVHYNGFEWKLWESDIYGDMATYLLTKDGKVVGETLDTIWDAIEEYYTI